MNTLRLVSAAVQFQNTACPRCGAAATGGTACIDCRVGEAEFEAVKLRNELISLVNGRDVYAALPVRRRADLLASMGFLPETVAPLLDDAALIAIVADPRSSDTAVSAASGELAVRLGRMFASDGAPNGIERQRIELQDEQEHRERTIERELAQAGVDEGHDGLLA